MGVLGDWAHPTPPCTPLEPRRSRCLRGGCSRRAISNKGLKPVYWCPKDETALAEAEIEYQDDPCTTVYVKFPMNDDLGKLSHVDKSKLFFVIWTTTIWTCPATWPSPCIPMSPTPGEGSQRRDLYHGRGPDRQGHEDRRL